MTGTPDGGPPAAGRDPSRADHRHGGAGPARWRRPDAGAPGDERVFAALPVGDDAREAIRALVDRLRGDPGIPGAARVRWAISDNLHLTLRFLGATAPGRVPDIVAAVEAAAAGVDPIVVRLAGAGAYPSRSRPRVVWLGIERGAAEIAALAASLDRELAERGWPLDDRPFRPHLTLGRCDGVPGAAGAVASLEAAVPGLDAGWTADRLVLYRSVPGHGPPRYEPLAAAELGGAELLRPPLLR